MCQRTNEIKIVEIKAFQLVVGKIKKAKNREILK